MFRMTQQLRKKRGKLWRSDQPQRRRADVGGKTGMFERRGARSPISSSTKS